MSRLLLQGGFLKPYLRTCPRSPRSKGTRPSGNLPSSSLPGCQCPCPWRCGSSPHCEKPLHPTFSLAFLMSGKGRDEDRSNIWGSARAFATAFLSQLRGSSFLLTMFFLLGLFMKPSRLICSSGCKGGERVETGSHTVARLVRNSGCCSGSINLAAPSCPSLPLDTWAIVCVSHLRWISYKDFKDKYPLCLGAGISDHPLVVLQRRLC